MCWTLPVGIQMTVPEQMMCMIQCSLFWYGVATNWCVFVIIIIIIIIIIINYFIFTQRYVKYFKDCISEAGNAYVLTCIDIYRVAQKSLDIRYLTCFL
jgi:hypothetical protein